MVRRSHIVIAFARRFLREGNEGSANFSNGASSLTFGNWRFTFFLAKTRPPFVIAKSYTIYFTLTIAVTSLIFATVPL
jgi:hypothetical protein